MNSTEWPPRPSPALKELTLKGPGTSYPPHPRQKPVYIFHGSPSMLARRTGVGAAASNVHFKTFSLADVAQWLSVDL